MSDNIHTFSTVKQPEDTRSNVEKLNDMLNGLDEQAKKSPHNSSMIAGGTAVAGTYLAMTAAPAIAVAGSIIWALWSVGNGTQKATYKRWSKK